MRLTFDRITFTNDLFSLPFDEVTYISVKFSIFLIFGNYLCSCFAYSDVYKPKLLAYSSNIHPDLNIPLDCMSYLQANLSETKNLCIQFLLSK